MAALFGARVSQRGVGEVFRSLTAEDVEVRVAQASEKGCSLLLYKTARVDYAVLDETVGPERWACEYREVKGNLFCRIGIRFGDTWVWKENCGVESNQEAEKGEASDAFKRAGFAWGIGRELYAVPFIWVPASKLKRLQKNPKTGRWQCFDRFEVTRIDAEGGRVTALEIADEAGRQAFRWGRLDWRPVERPKPREEKGQGSRIEDVAQRCRRVAELRGVEPLEAMRALNASKAMRAAGVEEGQSEYTPEQMQVAVMVLDGWIRKAESDAQH